VSVKNGLFVLMIAATLGSVAAPSEACEMKSATDGDPGRGVASAMEWLTRDATDPFRLGAVDVVLYATSPGPEVGVSDGLLPAGSAAAASLVMDVNSSPPDDAPTGNGAKVPEPATLALLGNGLIGIASAIRIKRRPQGFSRFTWARLGSAAQL